jgi:hypothetical protein
MFVVRRANKRWLYFMGRVPCELVGEWRLFGAVCLRPCCDGLAGVAGLSGALVPLWRATQRRLPGSLCVDFTVILSLILKQAQVDLGADVRLIPHIQNIGNLKGRDRFGELGIEGRLT